MDCSMNDYSKSIADELRVLCADMVERASSGHPGAAMGLSDIAVALSEYINISPSNSKWLNRDRLVFSGGHVSALLYSLLHLWGYEVSMDDLKRFRVLDSNTPGHPELNHTHGVEITTGPLGQGVANAVGFAMASKRAKEMLGDIINHKVYCLCGDGDLQEGISYEACSIASVHNLDNLVLIYDSNNTTIEGDTQIAFNEDIKMRFRSQGFEVFEIDGHNFNEIRDALDQVKTQKKPLLIVANTKIGKSALHLEGSPKTHGSPLGIDLIREIKKSLNLNEKEFFISEKSRKFFQSVKDRGDALAKAWEEGLSLAQKEQMENLASLKDFSIATFSVGENIATRVSNGLILNAIFSANKGFIGGSADLAPSNNTDLKSTTDFPGGNNLHFGIREHAMGAICNGFANYGLFTPFCATFFVFSDYLIPSIRLASLMKSQVFYIFTHDSIGVGEDGATHHPIEQLSHLRAMPNILNWRPCDANENIFAWKVALGIKRPHSFILSRQNLPVLDSPLLDSKNPLDFVQKGAYIISYSKIAKDSSPQISLLASGSEVSLALRAQIQLEGMDISTQVISLPCFDLFKESGRAYAEGLFLDSKVLGIEALRSYELYEFADCLVIMDSFGTSGRGELLFDRFGFNVDNIVNKAKELLNI